MKYVSVKLSLFDLKRRWQELETRYLQWRTRLRFYKELRQNLKFLSNRKEVQRLWRERRRFYEDFQQDLKKITGLNGPQAPD